MKKLFVMTLVLALLAMSCTAFAADYTLSLGHIQSEEQEHGKMIYDYMSTNHMYS